MCRNMCQAVLCWSSLISPSVDLMFSVDNRQLACYIENVVMAMAFAEWECKPGQPAVTRARMHGLAGSSTVHSINHSDIWGGGQTAPRLMEGELTWRGP